MATIQFSEGGDAPTVLHRKKQLLPNIIDGMAKTRPEAVYAEIPRSLTSYDAGFRKITYRDLANAINGVAWLLEKLLGRAKEHETLAYIGPNDLGYIFMVLGAVKAGYKLLLISPRNTVSDHISLFKSTDCKVLLTLTERQSPVVTGILKEYPIRIVQCPGLNELLDSSFSHYPFPKIFAKARDEPLVVVHTSGTTSVPKPIIYTHDFAASYIQWSQLEAPPGFESQVSLLQSNRLMVTLPFFHVSGSATMYRIYKCLQPRHTLHGHRVMVSLKQAGNLYATLFDAIANQTTVITLLAGAAPSAQLVVESLKHERVDAIVLAAPLLEQAGKDPKMLDFITSRVGTITYGGGDVSQSTGNAIGSRSKVFNFNGSTETGSYPLLRPCGTYPFDDWKYYHPHPAAGLEFRPSTQGLYEAFIVRNTDFEDEQPVFKIFPDLMEYQTNDLFAPHQFKPGLWAYQGRADDIIVFKSSFLCNPIAMEQRLSDLPEIRTALMAGTGRYQSALLIEAESEQVMTATAKSNFMERIWPIIEETNHTYPKDAHVSRSHILLADPKIPIQRAGKGTVQRGPTLKLYQDALAALYTREGDEIQR